MRGVQIATFLSKGEKKNRLVGNLQEEDIFLAAYMKNWGTSCPKIYFINYIYNYNYTHTHTQIRTFLFNRIIILRKYY